MKQIVERQENPPSPLGVERVQCDAQSLITRLRQASECGEPPDLSHEPVHAESHEFGNEISKNSGPSSKR